MPNPTRNLKSKFQKRKCKFCGRFFYNYFSQSHKFCNHKCSSKHQTAIGTHFVICKICGKSFRDRISAKRKFCSQKCYLIYNHGKNNPAWKGGPKTISCQYCKKPFLLNKPHHNPNRTKFCSQKCSWQNTALILRKRVQKKCLVCGKYFEDTYIHSQHRKICSLKCREKYYKQTGKNKLVNNPNWKGGISRLPYHIDFNEELKEEIRKRDNYECQICHMIEEEHLIVYGKKQSIHHIDYDKQNCAKKNLKTLCNQCNSRVNFNREYWKEFFSVRDTIKTKNI